MPSSFEAHFTKRLQSVPVAKENGPRPADLLEAAGPPSMDTS